MTAPKYDGYSLLDYDSVLIGILLPDDIASSNRTSLPWRRRQQAPPKVGNSLPVNTA